MPTSSFNMCVTLRLSNHNRRNDHRLTRLGPHMYDKLSMQHSCAFPSVNVEISSLYRHAGSSQTTKPNPTRSDAHNPRENLEQKGKQSEID